MRRCSCAFFERKGKTFCHAFTRPQEARTDEASSSGNIKLSLVEAAEGAEGAAEEEDAEEEEAAADAAAAEAAAAAAAAAAAPGSIRLRPDRVVLLRISTLRFCTLSSTARMRASTSNSGTKCLQA